MKNLSAAGFLYVRDGGQILFSPIENDYPKIIGPIRNDNVRGSFRVEDLLVLLIGKEEAIYVIPQVVAEDYLDPVGGLKKSIPPEYLVRNWYSENGGVAGRPVVLDGGIIAREDGAISDTDGLLIRGGTTKNQRRPAYTEREVIENQFGINRNPEIIRLPVVFELNEYDSENMRSLKRALNGLRIFVDRGQATYLRTIFKKINDGTLTDKQHSELCRILNLKSKIEYYQTERL